MLGLWDGNPVKLDCDDHFTTADVIKKFLFCTELDTKLIRKQLKGVPAVAFGLGI